METAVRSTSMGLAWETRLQEIDYFRGNSAVRGQILFKLLQLSRLGQPAVPQQEDNLFKRWRGPPECGCCIRGS